jgi:hypothetical protein
MKIDIYIVCYPRLICDTDFTGIMKGKFTMKWLGTKYLLQTYFIQIFFTERFFVLKQII